MEHTDHPRRLHALARRAAIAALVVAAAAGCAAEPPPDAPPPGSEAVVGGRAERGYPSAVFLRIAASSGHTYSGCTGTVVGPRVVLTAGHCVDGHRAGDVSVLLGAIDDPTDRFPVASILMHPGYDHSGYPTRHDAALLVLRFPITNVAPATLGDAATGCAWRSVGYGATTADATTLDRRSVAQCIDRADDLLLYAHSTDGGLCYGDSGGPLMVEGGDTIVGVAAQFDTTGSTDDPTLTCGTYRRFLFTSVAAERAWLDAALAAAETEARCAGTGDSCEGCVAAAGCGWCAELAQCMAGAVDGPQNGRCAPSAWAADADRCAAVDPCAAHADCGSCVADEQCGWCGATSRCQSGDGVGPFGGSCPGDGAWARTTSRCP